MPQMQDHIYDNFFSAVNPILIKPRAIMPDHVRKRIPNTPHLLSGANTNAAPGNSRPYAPQGQLDGQRIPLPVARLPSRTAHDSRPIEEALPQLRQMACILAGDPQRADGIVDEALRRAALFAKHGFHMKNQASVMANLIELVWLE